jgi:predicted HTH transcriptional regulator
MVHLKYFMEQIIISVVVGFVIGIVIENVRHGKSAAPEFTGNPEDTVMIEARQAVAARTEKRLTRIMTAVHSKGKITNDGVEDLFCISDRTASTYLRTLTKTGKLRRQGIGRGTFYTPVE